MEDEMNGPYTAEKYQKDKERIKAAAKRWRDANPDKCRANRQRRKEKIRADFQRWKEENPERLKYLYRRANYKKKYGLTVEEYEALLVGQGGMCRICKTTTPGGRGRFHVDHNHETGAVRAILCNACNLAVGFLKDDPRLAYEAFKYLVKHE